MIGWTTELWDGDSGLRLAGEPSEGEGSHHAIDTISMYELVAIPQGESVLSTCGKERADCVDRVETRHTGEAVAMFRLTMWTADEWVEVERWLRDALALVRQARADVAEDEVQP